MQKDSSYCEKSLESKGTEVAALPPAHVEVESWTKWPGEEGLVLSLRLPSPWCLHCAASIKGTMCARLLSVTQRPLL